MAGDGGDGALRQLKPHWNHGMIAASIAISLLGAFTSTQLYGSPLNLIADVKADEIPRMCQAKASIGFHAVLVWTLLASLTFGFCSIWSLHFVAMLAYELDIRIGINTALTVLSSALAVVFTFAALASDLLWATYSRERKAGNGKHRRRKPRAGSRSRERGYAPGSDSRPLLNHPEDVEGISPDLNDEEARFELEGVDVEDDIPPINDNNGFDASISPENGVGSKSARRITSLPVVDPFKAILPTNSDRHQEPLFSDTAESTTDFTDSGEHSTSGRSSSLMGSSSTSTFGLSSIVNIAYLTTTPAKNIFLLTGETLYLGCTRKNVVKAFVWSLAITSMHYAGIGALDIPDGYYTLNYGWVALSGIISWLVCVIGCILMSHMETHLGQQCLFSIAATAGVTSMHFTGKWFLRAL
jgi:NO-binding membrane sensor protein with MHYT domain